MILGYEVPADTLIVALVIFECEVSHFRRIYPFYSPHTFNATLWHRKD